MTDMTNTVSQPIKRFDFKRVLQYLVRPREEAEKLAAEGRPAWLTPMLALSLTLLLAVVVTGYLQGRAAAMGEVQLPPDWQYWTPDMQNKYMQAVQATQGPAFLYVIPAVLGLVRLWGGWLIVSGLLHLLSTLFGGRGTMRGALNVVAWASLPFAVRDLLRVVYMLAAGHSIVSPGLAGFAATPFASALLANLDLFLIWHAFLMVLGLSGPEGLPLRKAAASVAIVLLASLLVQAGLGTLTSGLGGMMVTRPFI